MSAVIEAAPETTEPRLSEIDVHESIDKIGRFKMNLQKCLVGRNEEIEACLTGLVAGEHVLMVGDPGVAKSMLVKMICQFLGGKRYQVLLGEYTTPEELFGPLDLQGLTEGRYERLTANTMVDAHFAFLDEIWKASPAILNTLLTIMNEREFRNGDTILKCPLRQAFAASNEYPDTTGESNLGALFDRFMIRLNVDSIGGWSSIRKMMFHLPPLNLQESLTFEELDAVQKHSAQLTWSIDAKTSMEKIYNGLTKQKMQPGNRRMVKAVKIANAAATLDNSKQVHPHHLNVLRHSLWNNPASKARAEVRRIIRSFAVSSEKRLKSMADEAIAALQSVDIGNMQTVGKAEQLATVAIRELQDSGKFDDLVIEVDEAIRKLRTRAGLGR